MRQRPFSLLCLVLLLVLSLSFGGCKTPADGNSNGGSTIGPDGKPKKMFDDHWTSVKPSGNKTIEPLIYNGRRARRLSIEHIERSLSRLFPNITWTDRADSGRSMFQRLARTLGKPDYIYVTEGTRKPTALFMKFMDDAAGHLCRKAVRADLKNESKNAKMVVLDPRDVDNTLRFIRLKFHTIYVAPNSTRGIEQLRTLYDNALLKTSSSEVAWRAVCVAAMTDPEFFIY